MINDIINAINGGQKLTVLDLKVILLGEYLKYIKMGYKDNIFNILKLEGLGGNKLKIIKEAEIDQNNIDVIIRNGKYHITNLDIWILMNYYQIPSIIISTYNILETNNIGKNALKLPKKWPFWLCNTVLFFNYIVF